MSLPRQGLRPLASALLCAGLLGLAGPAGAGLILVNTLADNGTSGNCELREAIALANFGGIQDACVDANPLDPDEIRFSVNGNIALNGNPLDIDGDLTITGPGAGLLSLDAQNNSRVFNIVYSTVTLSGMTLENGNSTDSGGAIHFDGDADDDLTLRDMRVRNSYAQHDGGGLHVYSARNVSLSNTVLDNNGASQSGGGVSIQAMSGDLTIENSTLTLNQANQGGGLYLEYAFGGGTHLITHTRVHDNQSENNGGGLYLGELQGQLTLQSSVVSSNWAYWRGGGIFSYDASLSNPVIIRDTTLTGNEAQYSHGGGVFIDHEESNGFLFLNSTISGNRAHEGQGGGVYAGMMAEFINTTVVDNYAYEYGGGIFADYQVVLRNTIVANNDFEDLYVSQYTFADVAVSLVESTDGAGTISGSYLTVDPGLGPLQYHGGPQVGATAVAGFRAPMPTHLPLVGSPVINAGDNSEAGNAGLGNDQRGSGYLRVMGGTVDIGATEYGAGPVAAQPVPGPAAGVLAWLSLLLGGIGLRRLGGRKRGRGDA